MYSSLFRTLITTFMIQGLSLIITILIVPGIKGPIGITDMIAIIFIFLFLNTFIRPIIWYLTLPLNVITLGIFTLLINAFILLATTWISKLLNIGFVIEGYITLIVGALILSIIRMIMSKTLHVISQSRLLNKDLKWINELERAILWLEEQRDNLFQENLKQDQIIEENEKIIKKLGKNGKRKNTLPPKLV